MSFQTHSGILVNFGCIFASFGIQGLIELFLLAKRSCRRHLNFECNFPKNYIKRDVDAGTDNPTNFSAFSMSRSQILKVMLSKQTSVFNLEARQIQPIFSNFVPFYRYQHLKKFVPFVVHAILRGVPPTMSLAL